MYASVRQDAVGTHTLPLHLCKQSTHSGTIVHTLQTWSSRRYFAFVSPTANTEHSACLHYTLTHYSFTVYVATTEPVWSVLEWLYRAAQASNLCSNNNSSSNNNQIVKMKTCHLLVRTGNSSWIIYITSNIKPSTITKRCTFAGSLTELEL
jgi:hypothetical protein